MHKFYFNECLPPIGNGINLQKVFENSINLFSKLTKNESLKIEKNIITDLPPDEITIHGVRFEDIINNISDKNCKRNAYYYFSRCPIKDNCFFEEAFENELIEKEHFFLTLNAINLVIANKMNWFLYSLPINNTLKTDQLTITSNNTPLNLHNWYGEQISSDYIKNLLIRLNNQIDSTLDELKLLLEDYQGSNSFEKQFKNSQPDVQRLIVEKFEEAKNNNMLFPIKTDDNLIKKCQGKGNENTYELRFGSLGGVRVYFSVEGNTVFIGGMGRKSVSAGTEQSSDIKKASSEIKKLKLTTT
jgi:mRNA-degrading endonuclease RelE of RelBE toxin-antitoxin system